MPEKINLGPDTVVKRVEGLCSGELDDELVLMSVEQGNYYGMDPIGARIWSMMKDPISVYELCSRLLKDYAVDSDQCERDVVEFLRQLDRAELLNVIDEQAP